MEIIFFTATLLLFAFSALAIFDGLYLHVLKYRLYDHAESQQEHTMHLLRAHLFPAIVFFLYVQNGMMAFWLGTIFVIVDVLILAADAYLEGDSRSFMGGLPRWEYILHLFVNVCWNCRFLCCKNQHC